jgi:hypothetical protein
VTGPGESASVACAGEEPPVDKPFPVEIDLARLLD